MLEQAVEMISAISLRNKMKYRDLSINSFHSSRKNIQRIMSNRRPLSELRKSWLNLQELDSNFIRMATTFPSLWFQIKNVFQLLQWCLCHCFKHWRVPRHSYCTISDHDECLEIISTSDSESRGWCAQFGIDKTREDKRRDDTSRQDTSGRWSVWRRRLSQSQRFLAEINHMFNCSLPLRWCFSIDKL